MDQNIPIGIDLGTTYSCVSVLQYGEVEIIADEHGNRTMPSIVAFTDRERLIGQAAKDQLASNLDNTISCVKRIIGRKFTDDDVQEDLENLHYLVKNGDQGKPIIEVEYCGETRLFSPEEISAMILGKLKKAAENYLETKVTDAVITVPANFNDLQRQATKDAGAIAGLNVLRIINEPTAAAVAFGYKAHKRSIKIDKTILVFDLGGGTLDVSLVEIDNGSNQVISTAGNRNLGGFDFDNRLASYFAQEFKQKNDIDLSGNRRAMAILREHCEKAKRELATKKETKISIKNLLDGINLEENLDRSKFEDLCLDLFKSTLVPVEKAITDAGLVKNDIDEIVLVGGSTRIPKVQKILSDYFNGKELYRSMNPDEAIAIGAAIQASIINGTDNDVTQDMILLDVTPLSLGTVVHSGEMVKFIERNTPIPVDAVTKYFTTAIDNQKSVLVQIFEGQPQIKVTFRIDENGILTASAMDMKTFNEKEVIINKGQLPKESIERMIAESEQFRVFDEKARERNRAKVHLNEVLVNIKRTFEQQMSRHAMREDDSEKIERKWKVSLNGSRKMRKMQKKTSLKKWNENWLLSAIQSLPDMLIVSSLMVAISNRIGLSLKMTLI
ncbi:hypothetical protein RDWZM_001438 [Blomia tropicalis]|uniref:Blo t Mag29 allergen n=1 Tax=Blomia tropicalis TaxID=40697 RepID=A0A9Q0RNY5_BLOTA|nr:hypothetical protein RDWZM_001438 [Blomia tropicalis]